MDCSPGYANDLRYFRTTIGPSSYAKERRSFSTGCERAVYPYYMDLYEYAERAPAWQTARCHGRPSWHRKDLKPPAMRTMLLMLILIMIEIGEYVL